MRSLLLALVVGFVLSGCALLKAPTVVADCRRCVRPVTDAGCESPWFEAINKDGVHKCMVIVFGDATCPGEEEEVDDGNR